MSTKTDKVVHDHIYLKKNNNKGKKINQSKKIYKSIKIKKQVNEHYTFPSLSSFSRILHVVLDLLMRIDVKKATDQLV